MTTPETAILPQVTQNLDNMLRRIISNLYIVLIHVDRTILVSTTYHVDFALEAMENTAKGGSEATGYRWGQQGVKDSYESKWDQKGTVQLEQQRVYPKEVMSSVQCAVQNNCDIGWTSLPTPTKSSLVRTQHVYSSAHKCQVVVGQNQQNLYEIV